MTQKRKIFDKKRFKNCNTKETTDPKLVEDLINQGKAVNLAEGGVMGTRQPRPFLSYNSKQNERIIANANAYIVLGQDSLGTMGEGGSAEGAESDTIDLVVGRMASSHGGDGPCDGMFVGSSPAADAARIYISRATKVDHNFGIMRSAYENAYHGLGEEPARSAIAVKADLVRIIGRSGVKIVTGGMRDVKGYGFRGETDSFGNRLEYAPQIDLIAGNYTWRSSMMGLKREDYLQPIALGYRTRDAFKELVDVVDHLMGILFQNFITTQTCFSGIGSALPYLSAVTAPAATMLTTYGTGPSYNLRVSVTEFKFNFLNDRAPQAVWSRNVNST